MNLEILNRTTTPAMDSAFWEVLRLRMYTTVARQVMEDMEFDVKTKGGHVDKYFMRAGERIIMLTSILHQDAELYPNPTEYQWDRFLHTDASTHRNLRPFGRGAHYCPGRKFAIMGAKVLLAHVVYYYDVRIEGIAEPDMTRDGLGILHSKAPVQIHLEPRKVAS